MKHSPEVWRLALSSLDAGRPAALLYVVESLGSSPGRAGFALVVTPEATAGSIGGGAMEHRFIGLARELLASGGAGYLQRQVHQSDAGPEKSGMICSGEQTFWLHPLAPSDRSVIEAVQSAGQNKSGGVLRLSARGLAFEPGARLARRHQFVPGDAWSYEEDWGRQDQLHIVGGGHCALALSQLAAGLDFDITVYDDRPNLPTFEINQWAHEKVLVPHYGVMGERIEGGDHSYVCVMTFGYKTDDLALRSLLPRDYRFLGALGSRAKIDQLLSVYSAEGIDPERLRKLHAPLGLPIHSQTPAEIAVSVAAQLIRVRNEPAARSPS